MVTGIETAGLALAVFPIVVSGLQFYADGARTIKAMWRPEMALKSLIRDIGMEKCKFENTCTFLLEGMVSDSHLILLMDYPGGPLWRDNDLQEKLKSRLRPATAQYYMEAMEALTSTLQSLQVKLGLDKDDKAELADRKTLKKKLKKIWTILSKAEHKEILRDIAKINSDLATLTGQSKSADSPPQITAPAKNYKHIRNHAINLYGVLKEKLQAATACTCTVPHNANLRLEVRNATTTQRKRGQDSSLRFHVVLSFGSDPAVEKSLPWKWREMGLEPLDSETEQAKEVKNPGNPDGKEGNTNMAPCPTTATEKIDNTMSYPAMGITATSRLGITLQGHSESTNIAGSVKPSGKMRFSSVFIRSERKSELTKSPRNVTFNLSQVDCTDLASITPEPISENITKQIENLCLTIQQAKSEPSCLGILTDESNRQYRVWPPRTPSLSSEPMVMLSLENLLTQPEALKKKDRLVLGVQLASTVMQLHTTEWLSENWGKRDILFYQEGSGGAVNNSPIIRKPLVRRIFAPPDPCSLPPQTIQKLTKSILLPHNQSLFSLGVILVELWYGQRLEDLRIETDGNGIGGVNDMTDYVTARRLISEISEDAGEKYGDAVRRCINGLDHRFSSLEKDDFKNEVHIKVVSPLVENLESFCAMGLVEIL